MYNIVWMKYSPQLMGKWDWICKFSDHTVVSRRPSKEKKPLLIGRLISPGDGIQIISPVKISGLWVEQRNILTLYIGCDKQL
jgi:hypothetical protein